MRILFLSRWFPYPPDNGSKIRIFNILRQLSQEHEVVLLAFRESMDRIAEQDLAVLRGICREVEVRPYRRYRSGGAKALLGFLSTKPRYLVDTYNMDMETAALEMGRRHRFDLLIASQLAMVPYAHLLPGVPALLEELEITGFVDGFTTSHRLSERTRRWLTWLKLSGYLRRKLPEFAACTVVSEIEKRTVEKAVPGYAMVRVVPNAVDLSQYVGDFGAPKPNTLVFCGALTYGPNYDAVGHFLRAIYPLILRAEPDTTLLVTGNTSGADLASLPSYPAVRYTGYVPDVWPVVAQSWVSVVPLRSGGGTRLKILESMALGTPVVSTAKGIEGMEATDGEQAMIADEPEEFASKVVTILRSRPLRSRLAASGRRLVEARYDWRRVGSELRSLVDGLAWSAS